MAAKLVHAAANAGGWCELEQVLSDDRRRAVYVNAHAVRWVIEEDEARGYDEDPEQFANLERVTLEIIPHRVFESRDPRCGSSAPAPGDRRSG